MVQPPTTKFGQVRCREKHMYMNYWTYCMDIDTHKRNGWTHIHVNKSVDTAEIIKTLRTLCFRIVIMIRSYRFITNLYFLRIDMRCEHFVSSYPVIPQYCFCFCFDTIEMKCVIWEWKCLKENWNHAAFSRVIHLHKCGSLFSILVLIIGYSSKLLRYTYGRVRYHVSVGRISTMVINQFIMKDIYCFRVFHL